MFFEKKISIERRIGGRRLHKSKCNLQRKDGASRRTLQEKINRQRDQEKTEEGVRENLRTGNPRV
jgi:hypothetical protein